MVKPKSPSPRDPQDDAPKAVSVAVDWPAVLRSGPTGVRRWNRLTVAERKAIDLAGTDLSGADLSGANLKDAWAVRANFAGANLKGAKLSGGTLVRADLSGADLSGADLKDANLRGAALSAAILEGATWEGASFNRETTWSAGFSIPAELSWAGRGTDPRFEGRGKNAVAADINGLITRLKGMIDPRRMKRTFDMLKSGRNQIFAEVEPTLVRGVVRSQKDDDLVYSCVLTDKGIYSCATPDLAQCMGLAGEPCKHLLVLLIGLARSGELDPSTADRWIVAIEGKGPRWNKTTKDHVSDTLIRFKGYQAGEVDWRPTETLPEDFYAF